MSTIDPDAVRARLQAVVSAMKASGVWDIEQPAEQARVDMGAFGGRTMAFEQWLRWVFVPSVEERLASGGPWPDGSQVAVRATREGDGNPPVASLVPALSAFDALFEEPEKEPDPEEGPAVESPDAAERALVARADALLQEGRDEEARAVMEGATVDPHLEAAARGWLAWFFIQKRLDIPSAVTHGGRAVALRPTWGHTRLNLAWAHERAGAWADAYRGYLDALACGNSLDEAFAERHALELSSQANARGEPLPVLVDGSPAQRRLAGVERVMRAIVTELAAMPELGSRAWFAAIGIPVPEGDVPFGWIGRVAGGRAFVHALVNDLDSVAPVEVLARTPKGLVFQSHQVHGADLTDAVRAIATWVRGGAADDPQSLTPLDAAVIVRTALFQAVPGWRLRIAGGADYYAPDRPASLTVTQRRHAAVLGVTIEARGAGGVTVTPMPDAMGARPAAIDVPTYDALVALLPQFVESSTRALAAFDAFRARPLPAADAAAEIVTALREAKVAKGNWEPVVDDGSYPLRWPSALVWLRRGDRERHLVEIRESATGREIAIDDEVHTARSVEELRIALPEIVRAVRECLGRLSTHDFRIGHRFRVIADGAGLQAGEEIELVEATVNPREGDRSWVFENLTRRGNRVFLNDWVDEHATFLGAVHRYLERVR